MAFAKQNPSLEDFEKKLKSFQEVETQLRSMEGAKPIGMLLLNTSALYPQVSRPRESPSVRKDPSCGWPPSNIDQKTGVNRAVELVVQLQEHSATLATGASLAQKPVLTCES